MDPFTQGTLGAALPQATRHRADIGAAGALGFVSGMAADLDVLIRSSSDPLMFLEYHRQFTHSLIFIPVGGSNSSSNLVQKRTAPVRERRAPRRESGLETQGRHHDHPPQRPPQD